MRYSTKARVKGYGFMFFATNMTKNVGKISNI